MRCHTPPFYTTTWIAAVLALHIIVIGHWSITTAAETEVSSNLRTENLVAWCIVPFDAKRRGPEERAHMLTELGLKRLAYDWREEHIPTWDAELDALQEQSIELTAFWCTSSLHPVEDEGNKRIIQFLERRQVPTQLWMMLPENQLAQIADEGQRVAAAAAAIGELAERVAPLNCQVGLYNHGGWSGRPNVMLRVMRALSRVENVGIVYNFHHAHEDLAAFPGALAEMRPYLLCLNLNGTSPAGPKILPLGQGELDADIMQWIRQSEYTGPIGILDHRNELDAKESLQQNLSGLQELLREQSAP